MCLCRYLVVIRHSLQSLQSHGSASKPGGNGSCLSIDLSDQSHCEEGVALWWVAHGDGGGEEVVASMHT